MHKIIEQNREQILNLCQQFHVKKLDVFGSVLRSDFNEATSDLDFIVTFENLPPVEYAQAHIGLLLQMEKLLQKKVDLVTESSLRNPYFKKSIDSSRQRVYLA